MQPRVHPRAPLAAAALACLAVSALTQSPPTVKVYSRETIVDITVTDSKGNPVHGLTKENFTVKEDGKPQPIRSFEEFSVKPTPPPPKLPPNVYTNLQPPATGTVNILLLDFLNIAALPSFEIIGATDTYARALAAESALKREAKKYVSTMPPGTRVIVLGLSTNLRTLQGYTSDPALISAAIDTMELNGEGRASTYEQFCAQSEQRIRMTLESLNQIAAGAAQIKGKKNLLWFTVGTPWLTDPDPSMHARCLPDYFQDLLKTYNLIAEAQIAVYPIDVRGVPTMPNAFITAAGVLWANIPALPGPAWQKAMNDFMMETAGEHLSMESIAEATGGYAYYNSNDLASLIAQAMDKGSSYYTLSYVPPGQKYNWAHHNIKIAVDQPDLHLVYRKTYDAVDPATIKPAPGLTLGAPMLETSAANSAPNSQADAHPDSLSDAHPDPQALMRAAMGRSMSTSQQLLFDVQVEPSTEPAKPTDPPIFGVLDPKLKSKPLTRYGFVYALPARQLAFSDASDGLHDTALEFDLAAYDAQGNVVTSLRQATKLHLTADQVQQLAKGPFRYFEQLDLPAGPLFLRIGILDRTSSKLGTLEIPLTIPKK